MWINIQIMLCLAHTALSRTETVSSRPELPQNDVYNNKVDDFDTKIKTESGNKQILAKLGWDMLNRNNARPESKMNTADGGLVLRGPPGPRGPPGAVMTKEEMTKQFKKMVKAAAQRKARKTIKAQCPTCKVGDVDGDLLSLYYPGVQDRIRTINKAPVAFTAQLLRDKKVHSGNRVKVEGFQLSGSEYGLIRGVSASLGINGAFSVERSGIYHFIATLNFHSGHRSKDRSNKENYVEVRICPNSKCEADENNRNLIVPKYRHSMTSRQRYFTVQLSAQLKLKENDHVSVVVNNLSRRVLTIQKGSTMSGGEPCVLTEAEMTEKAATEA